LISQFQDAGTQEIFLKRTFNEKLFFEVGTLGSFESLSIKVFEPYLRRKRLSNRLIS